MIFHLTSILFLIAAFWLISILFKYQFSSDGKKIMEEEYDSDKYAFLILGLATWVIFELIYWSTTGITKIIEKII